MLSLSYEKSFSKMDEKGSESSSVRSCFFGFGTIGSMKFAAPNIAVGCMIADRSGTAIFTLTLHESLTCGSGGT